MSVLLQLIGDRNRIFSGDDLIEPIWQGRAVSNWSISAAIKAIRIARGGTAKDNAFVRTLHGQSYPFVADAVGQQAKSTLAPKRPVRIFRASARDRQLARLA